MIVTIFIELTNTPVREIRRRRSLLDIAIAKEELLDVVTFVDTWWPALSK